MTSIARSFAIVFRVDCYAESHKNTNLPTVDEVGQQCSFNKKEKCLLVATSMVLRLLGAASTWTAFGLVEAASGQ